MEAQKRPGFQLDHCAAPQRKKAFQVPKASELATWKATARAPSDVSRLLDVGYVFGIDIETHDWVEHRATKASIGQLEVGGFKRMRPQPGNALQEGREKREGLGYGPGGSD